MQADHSNTVIPGKTPMIENFAGRLRIAAGVSTTAEKVVPTRPSSAVLEGDDTKRRAALWSYEATVDPMIQAAVTVAAQVAQEVSGCTLLEAVYVQADDNVLARRTFYMQRTAQTQRPVAREMQQTLYSDPIVVGSLSVLLAATGLLHFEVSNDRPRMTERSDTGVPVHTVTQERVEDAFVRLLGKVR